MKKTWQKNLVSGLCLAFLLGSPGWALGATTDQQQGLNGTAKQAPKTYTLQEIKTFSSINGTKVLQQKKTMDIKEADKFSAEMDYYDAMYRYGNAGGITWINWDNAIQAYKDAEDTLKQVEAQSGYDGESRFIAYQQMERSIAGLAQTLALQEELLRIEKVKLTLGLNTQTAVEKVAMQISELKANLRKLQNAQALAGLELMRQIGQPENTPFKLAPVEEYPKIQEKYELEKLVATATENSLSLKQLDRAIENLDDKIDQGGLTVAAREQLAAQANNLKLSRQELRYSIKVVAQNGLETLAQSQANLVLLKDKTQRAQADLAQVQMQLALGLVPKISVASSQLDLLNAQDSYDKAVQDHYLTLRSLALLEQGMMVSGGGAQSGGAQ